jgi:catechol 2,3-dioxygenase-like lactoylglutathione lyase family enzyme
LAVGVLIESTRIDRQPTVKERKQMAKLKSVGAITLFVQDPQRSKEFYSRVFEVEVVFEDENSVAFKFDNLFLNLLKRGVAVNELLGPVPAAEPGASFELTIWVQDADAVCADLADRDVSIISGPLDRPWGMRTAAFLDPDGYVWEVAAELSST